MKKSVGRQIVGLGLVLLLFSLSSVCGSTYWEDFSSDPGWVTNNPSRYYWRGDPNYDFHLEHVNESGDYAYTTVDMSPSSPFILEFDIKVDHLDWSTAAHLGLWDEQMRYDTYHSEGRSSCVFVGYKHDDQGLGVMLFWAGRDRVKRAVDQYSWRLSTWYHNRLEYDPMAGQCHLEVTEGKGTGGALVADLMLQGLVGDALLEVDVSRLGNTGRGDWAVGGAGSAYQIDNVEFSTFPVNDLPLEAEVDIDPDTLNLRSRGRFITAYIELPEGHDPADIDVGTVCLAVEGSDKVVSAEPRPTAVRDHDRDGVDDLMVKFDRQAAQELLSAGEEVVVYVGGLLIDGTEFLGSDTIRVIDGEAIDFFRKAADANRAASIVGQRLCRALTRRTGRGTIRGSVRRCLRRIERGLQMNVGPDLIAPMEAVQQAVQDLQGFGEVLPERIDPSQEELLAQARDIEDQFGVLADLFKEERKIWQRGRSARGFDPEAVELCLDAIEEQLELLSDALDAFRDLVAGVEDPDEAQALLDLADKIEALIGSLADYVSTVQGHMD